MKSQHYCFVQNLKIVEKQLCKLNCSYGKVPHTLKEIICLNDLFDLKQRSFDSKKLLGKMKKTISLLSVIWNKQVISLNQRKIFLIYITNAPGDCAEETSLNISLI